MITRVCHRIPPLWDLPNYVAVNPFLGFSARPLAESAREIGDGLGARVLPGLEFYRARWKDGAFGKAELERAARRAGQSPAALEAILTGAVPMPVRAATDILTCAERYDRRNGTAWNDTIIRYIARWCTVYESEGGTYWPMEHQGFYVSWRETAVVDRSLEIAGLAGWREWAKTLPEDAFTAIEMMLTRLEVPAAEREAYLYRLLGGVFGWASLLRRTPWEAGDTDLGDVAELLAVRICTDAAVARLAPRPAHTSAPKTQPAGIEDEGVQVIFQEALEDGYARRVLAALVPPPTRAATARPDVQAVFCIDVRSEVMRRHLEAQTPGIETLGFAGFFAVFLDYEVNGKHSARCPVLLKPGVHVPSRGRAPSPLGKSFKDLQIAPGAAFTFVETLGLFYGLGLAGDALTLLSTRRMTENTDPFDLEPRGGQSGVSLAGRLDMAALILKNMGLRDRYGRIVMLCGHESTSENNSHAAGLDCGACGGHGGGINARIAAAVLNDPSVREGLPARGYTVPADTWFLPAVHDTAVDQVTLLDTDRVPASHAADLERLRRWLAQAGAQARAERAGALGLAGKPASMLDQLLRRRSRDWSEVRQEWALARNAAFIAARRARTCGVNLEGRSFLHEYDWTTDPDNSILTLILTAPTVVASWINLQYFASTVDNHTFGCGTKVLHNRVGAMGVVIGNGGDLRTGLAQQSVHAPDGSWYHEPLRLQVIVEAPRERIEAVLNAHAGVKNLVENGWIRLFALDPDSTEAARWVPGTGWDTP
jgi:hypothetical protein